MTLNARKALLLFHIITTISWLGSILAYVPFAFSIINNPSTEAMKGYYLAMEMISWKVTLPLSVSSFISGLILALTSKWGLFKYYWVTIKIGINLISVLILIKYLFNLSSFLILFDSAIAPEGLIKLQTPGHLVHALLASFTLLIASYLSVFKKPGIIKIQ